MSAIAKQFGRNLKIIYSINKFQKAFVTLKTVDQGHPIHFFKNSIYIPILAVFFFILKFHDANISKAIGNTC